MTPRATSGKASEVSRRSRLFTEGRAAAGFDVVTMARFLGVSPEQVRAFESGEVEPSGALLDRYARAFGLNVRQFLAGEADGSAFAVLFRSMSAAGAGLDEFVAVEAHGVLGEFARTVADLDRLRRATGDEPDRWSDWSASLAAPPLAPSDDLARQAASLAAQVRARLGLGDAPVASVRALVRERFGVEVLFLDDGQLHPQIDGASTTQPIPAILVNLVYGADAWWRTRMTILHELCHLLFDRNLLAPRPDRLFLFSPEFHLRRQRRWQLLERFADVEARAGAFAAHFLAPDAAVRQVVGKELPTAPEVVHRVMTHFGIGWVNAINRLQDVFFFSSEEREAIVKPTRGGSVSGTMHPDVVRADELGLRGARLSDLTQRALVAGTIDTVEARGFLGLRASDPLPPWDGVATPDRAPIRTRTRDAEDAAIRHLMLAVGTADLFVQSSKALPGGRWQVVVGRQRIDAEPEHAEVLELDATLRIVARSTERNAS